MPTTKTLLTPNKCRKWGIVLADARPPFYVPQNRKWQILLGPESAFSISEQVLKVAAEFDQDDFSSLRVAAYLYQPSSGLVSGSATCQFNIYKVTAPLWVDQLIASVAGALTPNNYFFADVPDTTIAAIDMSGGDTVMIEAVVTRLSEIYRERIYVNHLGIFDSHLRLKNKVTFLELTKLDE